jgi:hypothetical protein
MVTVTGATVASPTIIFEPEPDTTQGISVVKEVLILKN